MDPSVKIVVAAHKPYWMPDDPMYLPVQVGAVGRRSIPGFQRDDEGDNISEKNPRFSELTALYWAWKNLDCDYVGLAHYRRHFATRGGGSPIGYNEILSILQQAPVVLPRKRSYYIETVGAHYSHTFDGGHLQILGDVLLERAPEMLPYFTEHLEKRSAHIWNMVVMRSDVFDEWCQWLMPVLQDVESRLSFDGMSPFEQRVIGRLSERLLDPWLNLHSVAYEEVPVYETEKTKWMTKGSAFLAAKFLGKKYRESF